MATLLFAAAGSAIGGAIGGSVLGVSAAAIGQAIGATLGRVVDSKLMGGTGTITQEGPRLDTLDVMTSQEGAALADISGRTAISGEVIWAARLKETANTTSQTTGSGKSQQTVTSTTYSYSASFAVSLGEGPLSHMGRIWIDGQVVDLSTMINSGRVRFYNGNETQTPDYLIEAIEGHAPAYRGTAYVVFEDLPLAQFGNRIPQVRIEVFGRSGDMEDLIRGVNVIPGATEWGYLPTPNPRVRRDGQGNIFQEDVENANRHAGIADWTLSMDMLSANLPAASTVSLIAAWFGTDLRAGLCSVEPRVELKGKETKTQWSAGGLTRASANVTSTTDDGRPAYGSSPADISLVRAIKNLRARGKRTVLYPFIMMDITDAQALPDPSGLGTQGAYPWRGRIEPRAGQSVAAEVAAFMGTAAPSDFSVSGETVTYSGPAAFGFRRFILHLAHVAKAAGGVDAFLVGTEMRGLSMARHSDGSYPFVDALRVLAAEVSAILPSAAISYAADWSEYHSDRPGNEILFHLDPLWSDPAIDFVGIDNYLPLSDWRGGTSHADFDALAGITTPYSLEYLKGNIEGGEYWDWFYADSAARSAQDRTPIEDVTYGEPWVYRQKAIRDWHQNAHHERDASGIRAASPTAWVPGSKPIWFTEIGCPAVEFGGNQPNVFNSRISSEGGLPYFSTGIRDDFMQRQFIRASLEWWRDNGAGVLDIADAQVWCWDARPWPEFPNNLDTWSDGPDWRLGHWLNGRAGTAPAAEAMRRRLVERHNLVDADFDFSEAYGQGDGYASGAPISFREYIQPFEVSLGLTVREDDGRLIFSNPAFAREVAGVTVDDMAESGTAGTAPFAALRSAIEDTAGTAIFRFRDGVRDYEAAAVRDEIEDGPEDGTAEAETPLILDFDRGASAVARILRAASAGRETLSFSLPRSARRVRPGLILPVAIGDGTTRLYEVTKVIEGESLAIEARSYDRRSHAPGSSIYVPAQDSRVFGSQSSILALMDLPLVTSGVDEADGFIAAHAEPWPGLVVVARSYDENIGFAPSASLAVPATLGETVADLDPDASWTYTQGPLDVRVFSGSLVSRSEPEVLGGANSLAVKHGDGWEIIQFRNAELIDAETYRLSGLLRGQRGTESLSGVVLPAFARVVLLDDAIAPAGVSSADVGLPFWYRYGPSDVSTDEHLKSRATFTGIGRRPFAPVHLKAAWSGGDAVLNWTRRTRTLDGTFPASGQEPPIGEVSESYRVEIGPVGAPIRVATVAAPTFTYTAADQSADGVTLPVAVRVSQISDTFGPGPAAALNLKGS
ncbi:baseplate multidomain protein megatron [Roseobacter weihaiensis]|uniref:baseplate multidomain protein megatron n=1 Tax=Roseobacter weihaiensis TaxID=2763262 RepID=UPI001D0A5655|nr:glycoside hydrolase TIM-barrel-like domain-containing protein [Roseobacter sp. H9]